MRFMPGLMTLMATAAMVAGVPAAAAPADRAAAAEAKLAKALEGRVAGEPVRCISQRGIRSTTVIDGTAILYDVGGKLYLNRPDAGASSLDDDDILVTKTGGTQLCDMDIVRLIDRSGHFPRGFVNLGQFVPYAKAKAGS